MISISPLDQLVSNNISEVEILRQWSGYATDFSIEEQIGKYTLFKSGKEAIKYIIKTKNLQPIDEVFITTTTGSSYVSTCVSATIFNYCRISRVLTKDTKAIFVIHTFCFPHPDLLLLRKIATERNIILIEDCIAAFDSYNADNIRLGSIGDYAVFSLPKIIPVKYGGILFSKTNDVSGINDDFLANQIKCWEVLLPEIKKRRRDNYFFLKEQIGNQIYLDDSNVNPYKYGFFSKKYNELMQIPSIEFGKTHVEEEVHLPVNPFINFSDYKILYG